MNGIFKEIFNKFEIKLNSGWTKDIGIRQRNTHKLLSEKQNPDVWRLSVSMV